MRPILPAHLAFLLLSAMTAGAQDGLTFGPGEADTTDKLDVIVAVVNDDVITRTELDDAVAIRAAELGSRGGGVPPREAIERRVLDELVVRRLQMQMAEREGVTVDDQTLNATLRELAARNGLTLSGLREAVESDLQVPFDTFRERLRNNLLVDHLRQRVVADRVRVTEQEVDDWLSRSGGQRRDRAYRIGHILIAVPQGAPGDVVAARREEAQAVLARLRDGADFASTAARVSDGRQALQGGDLGWRRAGQLPSLFASVVPALRPGELSDVVSSPSGFHIVKLLDARGAGGPSVVQTRIRHILVARDQVDSPQEGIQRLQRLRDRILNGEDFAALARANSDDAATALQGGDLGWTSPGQLAPPFDTHAGDLNPGQVSMPFETARGWHLVQVVERRQQDDASGRERAAARDALAARKMEEELERWLLQLRDEAYVELRL